MSAFAKEIIPVYLEEEMKQSYLDYAMSVIIGRALPDVRDGLKPVHRRVLYALHELGNDWNKPYKKSARIVGDVIGKYHPHGDSAVYETMVRMAQPFSLRYMLVDGQGNFGCFTGDTSIQLPNGVKKTFFELAQLPPETAFSVYVVDEKGKIVIAEARHARVTRPCAALIELTLDTGDILRCTEDHLFLLADGSYQKADSLTPNDLLMSAECSLSGDSIPLKAQHCHRVTNIRVLAEREDAYDIVVDTYHHFLLGCGVFVHNSVDGDPPAAMRYTEVRMARIAHDLLADLDKETVDFVPNYDDSEKEPSVLPTRIPNLLVNGSTGIAVGMATNIPPHNLIEIVDACLLLIEKPKAEVVELMRLVPGPDFPTAGWINGSAGIREAYLTGRGRVYIRATCHFENNERSGRESIIVTELPYQVNKARLMEKIAELVKEGKITGIAHDGFRDESDKDGLRMVIEVKRGESAEVLLNNLYQQTAMQTAFSINMVALIDGRPRCLNLKELLAAFLNHRREVVTRRTMFELRKAKERTHILEGLSVALAHLDEVIYTIKTSPNPAMAKERLLEQAWSLGDIREWLTRVHTLSDHSKQNTAVSLSEKGYKLSEEQAQAILDLRLHRLTSLEQNKILEEYQLILLKMDELTGILKNDVQLMSVIREELIAIREQYGDHRRTQIIADHVDLSRADLIDEEDMVVTVSREGYVKSQPLSAYSAQRRGGRGKSAATTKEEDYIQQLIMANTHATLLCFSSLGKVYSLKVYDLPVASRVARGRPFVNLLPLEEGEKVNAILPVQEFDDQHYVFMATASGIVKKVALNEFECRRASGKVIIGLRENDYLVNAAITDGQQYVMLFSDAGKAVCFKEDDVRPTGRTATGVRGMRLGEGQKIIALIIGTTGSVLNVTENGYGKRTDIENFSTHRRGGQGVIAIQTEERNGAAVGAVLVNDQDELMLITNAGKLVRTRVGEMREIGRNAKGVVLIRLSPGEKVVSAERIPMLDEEENAEKIALGESDTTYTEEE